MDDYDSLKVVYFYKPGAADPFWKVRTVDVFIHEIQTPPLLDCQPRCEAGMRVTVDGQEAGTVLGVARIGASNRWSIEIAPPKPKRKRKKDEGDAGPPADEVVAPPSLDAGPPGGIDFAIAGEGYGG